MRHCHFSILYNEIAFLKQKLPFLYKHFDQLIFFDLNILDNTFSNDGSHEFIKEFHDPEKKIIIIEKQDLSDVIDFVGCSSVAKRQMFAVGSKYVRNDIDYFWCTDMDEFFNASLIKIVEENVGDGFALLVPHIVFWKNEKWIGVKDKNTLIPLPWPRIVKHTPGNIYGHCSLHKQFNVKTTNEEFIYHFAFIGMERVKFKEKIYSIDLTLPFLENEKLEYIKFNNKSIEKYSGYYDGVVKNKYKIPKYINVPEMLKDLK